MTKIEWVRGPDGSEGISWNALRAVRIDEDGKRRSANHCEHVNEACRWCYADRTNVRLGGLPFKPGHRKDYTFEIDEKKLLDPLRRKKPTRIFVESMSDAFGEWWPDEFIDKLYAVMALCPQHTFINLSKRPERRRTYLSAARAHPVGMDAFEMVLNDHALKERSTVGAGVILQGDIPHLKVWPLPNVIEGTSVSCQEEADEFVPILLMTPAALRVVSAEPLLGPIDFRRWLPHEYVFPGEHQPGDPCQICGKWTNGLHHPWAKGSLDWIIVGGESGPQARPMHPRWAHDIRDQCAAAGVPFFFKQWGEWARWEPSHPAEHVDYFGEDGSHATNPGISREPMVRVGKARAGRLLDGVEHNGFPAVAAARSEAA